MSDFSKIARKPAALNIILVAIASMFKKHVWKKSLK